MTETAQKVRDSILESLRIARAERDALTWAIGELESLLARHFPRALPACAYSPSAGRFPVTRWVEKTLEHWEGEITAMALARRLATEYPKVAAGVDRLCAFSGVLTRLERRGVLVRERTGTRGQPNVWRKAEAAPVVETVEVGSEAVQ